MTLSNIDCNAHRFKDYNMLECTLQYLGLKSKTDFFLDLKNFLINQNLDCAQLEYSSYLPTKITAKMKNIWLGEVMRHQALNQKDLSSAIGWLIDKGADPNYSYRTIKSELHQDRASSYTPLISAFESANIDLYRYLLDQGSNPDASLYTYSTMTQKWDQKKPIIKEIVDRILIQKQKISQEKCSFYKTIIDLTLAKHQAAVHSFDSLSNLELEALLYKLIRNQTSCSSSFPLKEEHKSYHSSQSSTEQDWNDNKIIKIGKILNRAYQKLWEEYFPDLPLDDIDRAFKILGLNRSEMEKMDPIEAKSILKKVCRNIKAKHHPDKGGDDDFFTKVVISCDAIIQKF